MIFLRDGKICGLSKFVVAIPEILMWFLNISINGMNFACLELLSFSPSVSQDTIGIGTLKVSFPFAGESL